MKKIWIKIKDVLISFGILIYVIIATLAVAIVKSIDYIIRQLYKLTFKNYERRKDIDDQK